MVRGVALGGQNAVRVIGILRGCPPEHLVKVAEAATSEGVTALEVTFDSDDPTEGISRLRAALPGVAVGAGTVLTGDQLRAAFEAGAEFVVSPVTDREIIADATDRGLACIPGAATPTEVREALSYGADAVKLFPADAFGGPDYVSAILTPLGPVPLVPTGGVTAANGADYLRAGAAALGVGSWLFPPEALVKGDVALVAAKAHAIMKAADGT